MKRGRSARDHGEFSEVFRVKRCASWGAVFFMLNLYRVQRVCECAEMVDNFHALRPITPVCAYVGVLFWYKVRINNPQFFVR